MILLEEGWFNIAYNMRTDKTRQHKNELMEAYWLIWTCDC